MDKPAEGRGFSQHGYRIGNECCYLLLILEKSHAINISFYIYSYSV
jgi:hypothetical protein